MSAISCAVNFKENFTKNIPYYKLLLKQISDAQAPAPSKPGSMLCEHIALSCHRDTNLISKICEGYQFIIAFDGQLADTDAIKNELKSYGYCFTAENDAELALICYIHFGDSAPSKLCGCFSFIIYDSMRRQVFAASDRFSSVPLYYSKVGDSYILASQINGILSHPDITPRLSTLGVSQLLSFSKSSSWNIFEDIFTLPPAKILKIKDGDFIVKEYTPKIPDTKIPCEKALFDDLSIHFRSEKAGFLFLGGVYDELLFSHVADAGLKNMSQLTVYSFSQSDLFKTYSADNIPINFDDNMLLSAISESVSLCAIPTLSDTDFLINLAAPYMTKSISLLFTSIPDILPVSYTEPAIKNKLLCSAVSATLPAYTAESPTVFNSLRILALNHGKILMSPLLCPYIYDFIEKHRQKFAQYTTSPVSGFLTVKLRRLLLRIITDDTAPILAFFDKSALLKLCEGGFDLSGQNLTETEIISYLIKLNIWFLKYRPTIV